MFDFAITTPNLYSAINRYIDYQESLHYLQESHQKYNKDYIYYKLNDEKNTYVYQFLVPGFSKNDVHVEVENKRLKVYSTLNKERFSKISPFYKNFSYEFRLGDDYEDGNISAKLEHGILQVEISKNEKTSKKPTKIQIN